MTKSPIFVSCGLGVNSTAMLIYLVAHKIRPDVILFADTGGELPETYQFMDILNEYLLKNNFPAITVVRRKPTGGKTVREKFLAYPNKDLKTFPLAWLDYQLTIYQNFRQVIPYSTLEEECILLEALPSKAYGNGRCSHKWKIQPQEQYRNQWMVEQGYWTRKGKIIDTHDIKVRTLVGIHHGEKHRLFSKSGDRKPYFDKFHICEYPLIEAKIEQYHCLALINAVKMPMPSKSSCFFCPSRKSKEIADLMEKHPDLYQRALDIEAAGLKHSKSVTGLGRNLNWAKISELTPLEQLQFDLTKRQCSTCID